MAWFLYVSTPGHSRCLVSIAITQVVLRPEHATTKAQRAEEIGPSAMTRRAEIQRTADHVVNSGPTPKPMRFTVERHSLSNTKF
jgi:hypothetical protein